MRRTTTTIAILALCALPPRAFGQEHDIDSPAAALERGHYAEEHERDFEAAQAWYQTALTVAVQMQDAKRIEEAQQALARLERRLGAAPQEATPEVHAQVEQRIHELLELLAAAVELDERGGRATMKDRYESTATELALYGELGVRAIAVNFAGEVQGDEFTYYSLRPRDVANVLVRMKTPQADAALVEAMASANPLVRREVARVCTPERHRAALVAAAGDAVPGVREAAVSGLSDAPRPEDAPLLWAALDDGIEDAAWGLYGIDRVRLFERASSPEAPERLREYVVALIRSDRTSPPNPTAARFVLREVFAAPDRKERGELLMSLDSVLTGQWSPLPEELRALVETAVLDGFEQLPPDSAVIVLTRVGGRRALGMLPMKLIASAEANEMEERLEWLETLGRRAPLEDAPELARVYQSLPLPANLEGPQRERAGQVLYRFSQGMRELPWPAEDPAPLLACWDLLDPGHRDRFAYLLAVWMKANEELRVARAGGDADIANRPDSLDARFAPLARVLVRQASEDTIALGLRTLCAVGEVEALREHLAFAGSNQQRLVNAARGGAGALIAADPAAAREVLVKAIEEEWRIRPGARPIGAAELHYLPDAEALAAFRSLWPRLPEGDPRRAALLQQLATGTESPAGTALLVEHYADLPADQPELRRLVVRRVGNELYEPGIELLDEALRDVDVRVRGEAYSAFTSFRNYRTSLEEFEAWRRGADQQRDSVAELLELLASDHREVRLGAVQSLGALRAKEALPRLVRLLEEDDAELRDAVRAAIQRMSD